MNASHRDFSSGRPQQPAAPPSILTAPAATPLPPASPGTSTAAATPAPVAAGQAAVVNITPQSWTLVRTYGTFCVAACAPGEPCAVTPVGPRTAVMDLGDKHSLSVPIAAAEVAEDLCHEINSDGGEDSFFGVFAAAGAAPTADELAAARARLAAFYRRVVATADREWERSHSYLFISDVDRRAAQYLDLDKEWYYQPRETQECPGCGEKVKLGVAVCRVCRAVLDPEKAAKLGLAPAAPSNPVPAIGDQVR